MNPRWIAFFKLLAVLMVVAVLIFLFPPAFRFAGMAARDLLYFWWIILLVLIAAWLIWGLGKKK
jgi:hypothetical protein